jgi:hypothetical protein
MSYSCSILYILLFLNLASSLQQKPLQDLCHTQTIILWEVPLILLISEN